MKKGICVPVVLILVLLVLSLVLPTALAATTIFSDDFDDGEYSGWSTSGTVSINTRNHSAPYSVRLKGDGTMWRTVSTQGYSNVTFSWWWAAGSLESADHCYAEVNSGSGWTVVDQLDNGDDDYVFRSGSWSGSGIDDNPNFQIRFRVTTVSADYCFVDDVAIISDEGGDPTDTPTVTSTQGPTPTPTSTPPPTSPLDVAIYISTGTNSDKIMALMRAIDAMGHNVYGIGRYDIAQGRLNSSNFDVLVLGAGENDSKLEYSGTDALDTTTIKNNIRAFVSNGGGYVALEQGAHFSTDELALYDEGYVTSGTAGKYTIDIVDSNFGPGSQQAYMSDGGGYIPQASGAVVVAENSSNQPVIVRDTYGSGRVILSSFDLELRGDSELDWTIWDNWEMGNSHTNSEGCWTLLGRMLDWAATGNTSAPSISTSNHDAEKVAVVSTHISSGGAWAGLLPGIYRSIEYAGYVPLAIRFDEINDGQLTTSNFSAVVFPGGYSYGYKQGIDDWQDILDYVAAGGSYYGVCAGSFYASEEIEWDGRWYDYMPLFEGQDRGPLDGTTYPSYELLTVNVNDSVIGNLGDIDMMYYGGGWKDQLDQSNATTVATYEYSGGDDGKPDAIRFTYGSGNGHVLLIGSHPESRSGSNEDWIYWDNWVENSTTPLNNPDNPWVFVDAAFDNWLIP
jgi:glutamine amidotransferase-like uncharacterized protein